MSDLEMLWLVLAVIYGWECAHWLRRGSVAFVNFWGAGWKMRHPGAIIGNQRGGMVFGNPLPPLGSIVVGRQFPLSVSPDAIFSYVAFSVNPEGRPTQTARFYRFTDVRKIEAKFKEVRVNGELLLQTGSPIYAQNIAAQLKELHKLPQEKRAEGIRKISQAGFDAEAAGKRWREFATQARAVRWLANSLFVYVFLLAPVLIWRLSLKASWPVLVVGLIGLTLTTAMRFRRVHQTFFPTAEDERFTHFIVILLSPATAIRAYDVLSRPLLEAYEPLALAKVFGTKEAFREMARSLWREVNHPALPVCPVEAAEAVATEAFARETYLRELELFLKRNGLQVEDLAQAPKPSDESCRSYCPRCEAQFTTETGTCADCGGMPLVAFVSNGKK